MEGAGRKLFIETYGCQMNVGDTEIVVSLMQREGYVYTDRIGEADVILINTCSIRDNAEQRIWGRLAEMKRYRRANPGLVVGVIGCMAERLKEKLVEGPYGVDVVAGPDAYRDLPRLVREAEAGGSVGAVMEDVGGGGVDRHRTGVGSGIGRFLPDVQLEGLKFICRHNIISFLLSKMCRVSLRFVRPPRHIRPKRKLFRTKIRKLICMVFPAFPAFWNAVLMPTVLVGIRIACNSYLVNRQVDISFRGGRMVAFWRESGYDERTIT